VVDLVAHEAGSGLEQFVLNGGVLKDFVNMVEGERIVKR
jgi:hypothetical protein